jgi:hypothetical protein
LALRIAWNFGLAAVLPCRKIDMQTVHIKFLTENDRTRGFYELARRSRVGSLPGRVHQIPLEGLQMFDAMHIGYRRASDAELKDAHAQVRNPSATVL